MRQCGWRPRREEPPRLLRDSTDGYLLAGLAPNILGHEKPSITYGLYSGGNSLQVKRKALETVS